MKKHFRNKTKGKVGNEIIKNLFCKQRIIIFSISFVLNVTLCKTKHYSDSCQRSECKKQAAFLPSVIKQIYSLSQRWKQNIYSVCVVNVYSLQTRDEWILCMNAAAFSLRSVTHLSHIQPFFSVRLTKVMLC